MDRNRFVVEACKGKTVLHLGCADSGYLQDRLLHGDHLHLQIVQVAKLALGVDIEWEALQALEDLGVANLFYWDVHDMASLALPSKVDVIVAGELLEHLGNPAAFLESLRSLAIGNGASVLFTVPNAFSIRNLVPCFFGRELVNPDHNFYFSITTLRTLLSKAGFRIRQSRAYSTAPIRASVLKRTLKRLFMATLLTKWPVLAEGLIVMAEPDGVPQAK